MNLVRVKIGWHAITDSGQPDWLFRDHRRIGRSLRERIKGPQIYRFLFNIEKTPECYIGQSGCFEKRLGEYCRELKQLRSAKPAFTRERLENAAKRLNSDSKTRVCSRIQNAEQEGSRVEMKLMMDFPGFSFNGTEISLSSLANPFCRLVMENLAILDAQSSPFRVLNRGVNEDAKFFLRKLHKNAMRMAAAMDSCDPDVFE